MSSLVSADNTWLLLAAIAGGAALSIWLEQTYGWAARLSGPVIALLAAMALSNTGVIPTEAAAYDLVDGYLVPLAIPLLLFRANLRHIWRQTGSLLGAFHVAAVGTILGAFVATWLFQGRVDRVDEVAGIMTGSYIGGGVNFVAVRNTYGTPGELTNPLLVADNFIMAGCFGVQLLIAGSAFFRRHYPHPHSAAGDTAAAQALAARFWQRREISLQDIAWALALAMAIAATASVLTGLIKAHSASRLILSVFGNPFILITAFTTAVATLLPRQVEKIRGADELGMYLLYLFFFVIGVRADFLQVVKNVPLLFLYCLVMAASNLLFTLLVGKALRLKLEDLLLASNATLGGPATAAAMAISRGWSGLVLPGILVGLWGYITGTFLGILVTETIRRWG